MSFRRLKAGSLVVLRCFKQVDWFWDVSTIVLTQSCLSQKKKSRCTDSGCTDSYWFISVGLQCTWSNPLSPWLVGRRTHYTSSSGWFWRGWGSKSCKSLGLWHLPCMFCCNLDVVWMAHWRHVNHTASKAPAECCKMWEAWKKPFCF